MKPASPRLPATRLSDGTIRFIALLASLSAPQPPPLLCIEEPELGLHPDALASIGDLLLEAAERMQLIVTTHSDALVSALSNQPETVIACERPGAGNSYGAWTPRNCQHGWTTIVWAIFGAWANSAQIHERRGDLP